MPSPIDTRQINKDGAPIVRIQHGMKRFLFAEMESRTFLDCLGESESPSVIRVVPLLRVFTIAQSRFIAVGNVRIVVSGVQQVAFEVFLDGIWKEETARDNFFPLNRESPAGVDELDRSTSALEGLLVESASAQSNNSVTSNEFHVAFVSKGVAEDSRNAITEVREIRYGLELHLAETSAKSSVEGSQRSIVSALLQLGIILGRGADNAREAVREGLWVFLTDSSAYHSYRVLQDPGIINNAVPATEFSRTWMKLHDAAIRQCTELRGQLDAECISVHALLAAAAAVSSSREADAQTNFNTLAAVASFGLGIPALVLALYGADRLLPLDTLPRQFAFLPVAAGLVFAAILAVMRSPTGKRRRVWLLGAGVALIASLALLIVAGMILPGA
ncbi:hypothetical protein E3T43_16990 [Cryobacterium sp. Hh7]|uniref:hypothetical protein n=1 Tax=Cryobacterium sp. Hh7 TaxID=1259159 RepID=UPI001069FA6B|nr:hypothetical protein [Cryobacterium sp. Hh7]TFD51091.1 hypothetical protein E3T43_16990 [Cryobacterium sp. Hh7]